jgi:hypothetical protein
MGDDNSGEGLAATFSRDERPLSSYALLDAIFVGVFGSGLLRAARSGRLPEDVPLADVILVGVATHKVSRLLTRSKVAGVLRAPFTEYEGPGNVGEVNEQPRGQGIRRALGELAACPLCMGAWIAAGFTSGLVVTPRATRVVAAAFSALTIADFLHLAYAPAAEKAA